MKRKFKKKTIAALWWEENDDGGRDLVLENTDGSKLVMKNAWVSKYTIGDEDQAPTMQVRRARINEDVLRGGIHGRPAPGVEILTKQPKKRKRK